MATLARVTGIGRLGPAAFIACRCQGGGLRLGGSAPALLLVPLVIAVAWDRLYFCAAVGSLQRRWCQSFHPRGRPRKCVLRLARLGGHNAARVRGWDA